MNIEKNYDIGDIVTLKKGHPCGANSWQILRVGMDIKLRCTQCGRLVMLTRREFNQRVKSLITKNEK